MSETTSKTEGGKTKRFLGRMHVRTAKDLLLTLLHSVVWAFLFVLVSLVPMPYTMVSLIKLGLGPALAIIALAGAVRGPVAGFLSGYLGTVMYDLLVSGNVLYWTLPAVACGVSGLVVGLFTYDLSKGRSLAKLSVVALVGFLFSILLTAIIDLTIARFAVMLVVGLLLLPGLGVGIPSVILITPILARLWHSAVSLVSGRTPLTHVGAREKRLP